MTNILLDYLQEVSRKIEELLDQSNSSSCLLAFRGESKDYGDTKLMPSLFRKSSYIKKEKYLFELLCDYNMAESSSSNIEKAIETQHYVEISRMLDVTFNVLSAMFFSCDTNRNENGILYIFNFPEHYSPHSSYVEDFYANILENKNNITYAKNFKVFSHSYSNERIKAQKGGFIFFPGEVFSPISNVYYKAIEISKDDKELILKELETLFQINKANLFPEKENIAKVIKEKFDNKKYMDKEVTVEEEVNSCISRLEYEITNPMYKGKTLKWKKRVLRKEEMDLIYYVEQHCDESEKSKKIRDRLIELIKARFRILGGLI